MNGHSERGTSKTKGTRWTAWVYVDKDHGGPRHERVGTFDLKREADDAWQKSVYPGKATRTRHDIVSVEGSAPSP